jgi:sulfopyruvate decarboxylase subunit alpha
VYIEAVRVQPGTAQKVINGLKQAGVEVVTALPDSLLYDVYRGIAHDEAFRYIPVTNEGEGASICAGAWLGGKRSALIMENSGLRVASEALARLGLSSGVPVVMLMPYRGEFGEKFHWGINHGITMEPMLNALRIPYTIVRAAEQIETSIIEAVDHSITSLYHTAVIFGRELLSEPSGMLIKD